MLSQFRVQFMLILFPATIIYVLIKHYRKAILCGICLIANSWMLFPFLIPRSTPQEQGTVTRVIVFNVLTNNQRRDELLSFIQSRQPDIFVALETNQTWVDQLQPLQQQFPHHRSVPRSDNFGIAIYSKIPFDAIDVRKYGPHSLPSFNSYFSIDGSKVNLIATHPLPPMRPQMADSRNRQLAQAAGDLDSDHPRILVGDLNLTPWSPHFQDVLEIGNLVSASTNLKPTWSIFPTWLGGLKLDHVLHSPDIKIVTYTVGPNLGSDHRPVIVDFCIESEPVPNSAL